MQSYTLTIENNEEIRRSKKREKVYLFLVLGVPAIIIAALMLFAAFKGGSILAGFIMGFLIALFVGFVLHRVMVEIFPGPDPSDIIFQGMEECINNLLQQKGITFSERIYTGPFTDPGRNKKNAIVASNENEVVFLCDYLKDEEKLIVQEISASEIDRITYEIEPDELMKSYSNGTLYTGAGLLMGGVAGAIVGSVVGDLIDAGRQIKVKVKYSLLLSYVDGSSRTFDIINKTLEFSPKSNSILAEAVEHLNEKVKSLSALLRKNIPGVEVR